MGQPAKDVAECVESVLLEAADYYKPDSGEVAAKKFKQLTNVARIGLSDRCGSVASFKASEGVLCSRESFQKFLQHP